MSAELIVGFGGVALGFGLAEGSRLWQERKRINATRDALRAEALAVLHMLDDKKEILDNAIQAILQGGAIPGFHVRFPRAVFDSHQAELVGLMSNKERMLFHNIYERLRVADEVVEQNERILQRAILERVPEPQNNVLTILREVARSLETVRDLLTRYFKGEVVDVAHLEAVPGAR